MEPEKQAFPFALLPPYVSDYMVAIREETEAPREFVVFAALAAASTLAGSQFTVNGGVTLNNFYLIAGITGKVKKTTSLSLAADLLKFSIEGNKDVLFQDYDEQGNARTFSGYDLVTSFSSEGLQERGLISGGSTMIRVNEYAYVFNLNKRQNQSNTITDLTDLYDGKPISKRLSGRSFSLSDYSATILAASTPEWIKELGENHHIAGGFVNRHLVAVAAPDHIVPLSKKVPKERFEALLSALKNLIPKDRKWEKQDTRMAWKGSPAFDLPLNNAALKLWTKYYRALSEQRKRLQDSRLLGISAREDTHALKLAALRALLCGRKEIGHLDIIFGAQLARWSVRNAIELLNQKSPASELGRYEATARKIIKYLSAESPQSKTELARRLGGAQSDANTTLEILIRQGVLDFQGEQYLLRNPDQLNNPEVTKFFGKSEICRLACELELEVPRDCG